MKKYIVGLISLGVVGALAAPVQADPILPIVVTSGSWAFPANNLTFMADGLSLTALFPDFLTVDEMTCAPCSAARNPQINFAPGQLPFVGSGSGTFNGVSYPKVYVDGQMALTAQPVSFGELSAGHTTLTTPFTMTGSLAVFPTLNDLEGNLNVGLTTGAIVNDPFGTVTGSGTVTGTFAVDPIPPLGSSFDPTSITYQFQSPPLTPEPTTLLLFGTGVGLAWRRWLA